MYFLSCQDRLDRAEEERALNEEDGERDDGVIRVLPIADSANKTLNRQLSESTGAGKSELAAIEDVLILTPNSPTDN